jgi:hypothetical protein
MLALLAVHCRTKLEVLRTSTFPDAITRCLSKKKSVASPLAELLVVLPHHRNKK